MSVKDLLNKLYKDKANQPADKIVYPTPIKTGSIALNYLLNGGIRPGAFYSFMGPEQSGKSFMALHCISELLKADKNSVAFWFDCEFSFSEKFKNIFLPDPDDAMRLVVRRSDPPTGSTIFDWFINEVIGAVQDGQSIAGCVVDSIQTIIPPKEVNLKSSENHVMGDLSGYLPKALRLISSPCKPKISSGFAGIPWFFISQVRDELDAIKQMQGKKYHRSGGRAYGHNIDVEVCFEKIEKKDSKQFDSELKNMNGSDVQVGHRIRAKLEKNRFGTPARIAEFDIHYNKGFINQENDIVTLADNLNILTRDGNTYYFGDEKIGVGLAQVINSVLEDEELKNKMLTQVIDKYTKLDNQVLRSDS